MEAGRYPTCDAPTLIPGYLPSGDWPLPVTAVTRLDDSRLGATLRQSNHLFAHASRALTECSKRHYCHFCR
jgi:hypothetical protein